MEKASKKTAALLEQVTKAIEEESKAPDPDWNRLFALHDHELMLERYVEAGEEVGADVERAIVYVLEHRRP